jgi:hypothetical protein
MLGPEKRAPNCATQSRQEKSGNRYDSAVSKSTGLRKARSRRDCGGKEREL